MGSHDFALFALQIAVMLTCAVVFGQMARRLGQPAVLGEMIGGIILGPTLFGALMPGLYQEFFLSSSSVTVVRDASIKMGMLFFMFISGLEIRLSNLRRLRQSLTIGLIGTVLPIGFGIGLVYLAPHHLWGSQAHFFAFALFLGMNFANSANPVIARILMDLGLLKDEIGALIMTATIVDDLVNWSLFAIILGQIAPSGQTTTNLPLNVGLVIVFVMAVLVVGHWLGDRLLRWIRGRVAWPEGFIAATALAILLAAAVSEWLGLHAFLGAFLVGAALGDNGEEKNEAREVITHFVLSFFAPIYFVSMGLNANFVTNFDGVLVLVIVTAACVSKLGAVLLAVRLAGMPLDRRAWAIGFGLNARGATGIILASVGLEQGLIAERMFVAVVVMALFTSLLSGPAIKRLVIAAPATDADLAPQVVEG